MIGLRRILATFLLFSSTTWAVAMALGLVASTSEAWAQKPSAELKKQLLGSWTVVSQFVEQNGKKIEAFGPNPKGMFHFDPNGNFSIILMRPDLKKIAANNRLKGTDDENRAVVQGSIAYFGKYTIAEKDNSVTLKVEASTYPNWTGENQQRIITVKGDDMTIVSPTAAIGAGTVHLLLRRAK